MRKFKLIKEYPGSPKLNTVFDYWTDGISEQVYNKSNNPSFISLETIKKYPEFWEEVVEKEYEILSFKRISDSCDMGVAYLQKSGGYLHLPALSSMWEGASLEWMLKSKEYVINSIKRLSDGEV